MPPQQTSIDVYQNVVVKELGERQKQIYNKLMELVAATNAMLSEALRLPINCITPRIYELRKCGHVEFAKVDVCPITHHKAMFWRCKE